MQSWPYLSYTWNLSVAPIVCSSYVKIAESENSYFQQVSQVLLQLFLLGPHLENWPIGWNPPPPLAWCKEHPDLGPTHPSIMLPWILCYQRLVLIFNVYQNYLICFTLTTLALNQNHSPESELQLVVLRNRHFKVDPQLILMQVDLGLHREKHCILNSTPTLSMWFYSSTFPWPKMHLLLLISDPTNKFLKIQLNSSIQSLVKPASVSLLSVFLSIKHTHTDAHTHMCTCAPEYCCDS